MTAVPMDAPAAQALSITVSEAERVSALLQAPENVRAGYVLAHGAGAGMAHPFMTAIATALARRGIATLRYQFPYMEKRSKRPDAPKLAHATVRAAVAEAARLLPGVALIAGGTSFGGRMTSQAQALEPMPGVRGLVFLGFPLHPAGKPGIERAEHLAQVKIPMLFVSGDRDALAEVELLKPVVAGLGDPATLHLVAGADHSFRVAAKEAEAIDALATWIVGSDTG